MLNHTKKTCLYRNNISKSLRLLTIIDTEIWNIILWVSISSDTDAKALENKKFKLIFEAELDKVIEEERMQK